MIWLVNHPDNLAAALQQREDVLLVTSSAFIRATLQAAGREHVLLHQWYDDQARCQATSLTHALCRGWYTFEGEDFTRLGDYSLGQLFEFILTNGLSYSIEPLVATWGMGAFVSAMLQYGQLFERYPAQQIRHDWPPSAAAEALTIFCSAKGITCQKMGPATDPDSLTLLRPAAHRSFKSRLMQQAYPWTSIGRRLAQRLALFKQRRQSAASPARVATLHYPSLGGLSAKLAAHQITLIPAMPWFLAPQPGSLRQVRANTAFKKIEARWQTLKNNAEYRRQFCIFDIDCSEFFIAQLDKVLTHDLRQAAWQLAHAEQFFQSLQIAGVLLPFDAMPQARILILAARRLGIPSIVVQHGIMALAADHCDHPELTFADHALVLSQADADDLARREPPVASRVAGSLQLEQIPSASSPLPTSMDQRRLNVLVLCLCPSWLFDTSTDSADFMQQVVEALNVYESQLAVTFKLHPADSPMRYDKLMPLLAPRFPWEMKHQGSLQAMIAQSDLVISCVSTGVGESLAMGKPVFFIPPTHRIIPTGFMPDRSGLPTANHAAELASLLKPAMEDLPGYVRQYDFHTPLSYYRAGGASPAQLLVEHLKDILTTPRTPATSTGRKPHDAPR